MNLSIIIPIYNEKENIPIIINQIKDALRKLSYEIIFVNDGSVDNTEELLEELYLKNKKNLRVINFSRNFGKDAAIYAGLTYAKGKYTVIIDGDLQQNPHYLPEMYQFLEENPNYDVVAMVINKRKKMNFFKKIGSHLFYPTINKFSYVNFNKDTSDFRMFRENVKLSILSLKESNRFSKGIFSWIGFQTKYMKYNVENRQYGKTKYNFVKSCKYAFNGIINYSDKLLLLPFKLGIPTSIISFIILLYLIFLAIINKEVHTFLLTIFLILFLFSILMIFLGILGCYLNVIFKEVKNRPIYIIKNTKGLND